MAIVIKKVWYESGLTIPEASEELLDSPQDGKSYVRKDGTWVEATAGSLTKESVEAVLTGEISTHTHAGGSGLTQAQALTIGLL